MYPESYIKGASCLHRGTGLTSIVTRNSRPASEQEEYLYHCYSPGGRLLAQRRMCFATMLALINSWNGYCHVQEDSPSNQGVGG